MTPVLKFIIIQKVFSTLHTDTHDRLNDTNPCNASLISLKSQVFFRHSHNMVRSAEERFAMKRMATRGFGSKKIATALGVPEATTKRWLQRLRSDGDMASRNVGRPRGADGWCLCVMSLRVSFHISRNALCLWVQG